MIQVILSRNEFEYDIRSLIKAFMPDEEISFQVQELKPENILNETIYRSTNDKVTIEKNNDTITQENTQIKLEKDSSDQVNDSSDQVNDSIDREKDSIKQKKDSIKQEKASISLEKISIEKEIIYKNIKRINLYIIYEDGKITYYWLEAGKEPKYESSNSSSTDRKIYKNVLKRLLYQLLSEESGKILPWGTLTGIRPTKLPMEKLEKGEKEKDIIDFMEREYLCSQEKADLCLQVAKKELTILNEIDETNSYSIYIGIPFCPSTCLYCSFTSFSIDKFEGYVDNYLDALFKEIDYAASAFPNKKLITIYVGGGTPTTLKEHQLELLLQKITTSFNLKDLKEFTVEAGRPDSITMEKLEILKRFNVTRISINPQSMNQKTLDLIGRKHTVEQIEETFAMARKAGHDNINMDIILGLPLETAKDVSYTLEKLHELNPDSITVHTLAIKRAAFLNIYKEKYKDYTSSETVDMLNLSFEYAKKASYAPYYLYRQKNMTDNLENIGYARENKEGIYNILIMEERHPILALGAGASSKFVFLKENRIERIENVKSIKDYVERIDEMILRKHNFISQNF